MEKEAFDNILKICAVDGTDDGEQLMQHALFSIAISLKRIADAITAPPPMMFNGPELSEEAVKEAMSGMTGISKAAKGL